MAENKNDHQKAFMFPGGCFCFLVCGANAPHEDGAKRNPNEYTAE